MDNAYEIDVIPLALGVLALVSGHRSFEGDGPFFAIESDANEIRKLILFFGNFRLRLGHILGNEDRGR